MELSIQVLQDETDRVHQLARFSWVIGFAEEEGEADPAGDCAHQGQEVRRWAARTGLGQGLPGKGEDSPGQGLQCLQIKALLQDSFPSCGCGACLHGEQATA